MYDTIIVGRDVSSLVAALSSLRSGWKTILIMEGDPVLMFRDAGYAFPLDPRPLSGLVDRQRLPRFFREMFPDDGEIPSNLPMDPAFQVILSGHRVDIFPNLERLIRELIREFPEQEREINRFYRAVSKADCLVERWIEEAVNERPGVVKGILRQLMRLPAAIAAHSSLVMRRDGMDDAFRRVVDAQLNFLSPLDMDCDSLPLSAAYLLMRPMRGFFAQPGGVVAWMSQLFRAFTEQGGVLVDGCSVIRVDTDPDVTVDLESRGSSSTLRGKRLIISAQWEKLELLLPGQKILPAPNRHFASIHPAGYPFSLHMGVHEKGLPESMASHVVVVRDGKGPVTNRDLVFLQMSLPGETDCAPEGRRAVSATVYLTVSPLRLSDEELKDVAMRMIESLEEFLPFLRDNIDYLRVDQSIRLSRRFQEMVNLKYRMRRRPFFGTKTLSPKTRHPNVILTGGILRAGLGFEGEIIAGMDAAFRAAQGRSSTTDK